MDREALSNLVITSVRSVSTFYSPQNKKIKRIDRPCWAIVLKYEGETVYESGEKRFTSNLHHVTVLPKGCTYEWECTTSGHFSILEFECELTFPEPFSFAVKNGEKLLKMLREIEYKRNLKADFWEMESIADAYAILLSILSTPTHTYLPERKQQKLQPALEYISANINKPITNEHLAALSGMSCVYFRKLFTQMIGESPIAYVKRLRIEKAKEMLGSDYGTLSDIASILGYASLYDFSRDFKKHTGIPPSRYK